MKLYHQNNKEIGIDRIAEIIDEKGGIHSFICHLEKKDAMEETNFPSLYFVDGEPIITEYDLDDRIFNEARTVRYDKADRAFIEYMVKIERHVYPAPDVDVLIIPNLTNKICRAIDYVRRGEMSVDEALEFVQGEGSNIHCYLNTKKSLEYLRVDKSYPLSQA